MNPVPADPGPFPAPATLAAVALEAARAATAVHRRHLGAASLPDARDKGTFDFVSAVDLEAQEAALRVLAGAFPGHPVLAEEEGSGDGVPGGGVPGAALPLWIVDPLDGTTNYLHRHPAFAASVGVLVDGHPVAGAVVAAALDRAWIGWAGGGAWTGAAEARLEPGAHGRPGAAWSPVRTSGVRELGAALVGTGFPFKRPAEIPGYLEELGRILRRSSGVRREGSAALDLCRLASGSLDAFWEGYLAPWDVAGGLAVLGAAGGAWSGPGGAPYDVARGGPLRAANGSGLLGALHAALREPA